MPHERVIYTSYISFFSIAMGKLYVSLLHAYAQKKIHILTYKAEGFFYGCV